METLLQNSCPLSTSGGDVKMEGLKSCSPYTLYLALNSDYHFLNDISVVIRKDI